MDPLGFGLENYDAVGGWREKDGDFAIDAAGALPDGRGFKGPNELAAILESDREEFVRGFTAKLLTLRPGTRPGALRWTALVKSDRRPQRR